MSVVVVAHAMRRRPIRAPGQALQHVAEVAHERLGVRLHVDPAAAPMHLEPAVAVATEHGEQAVVGVLPHAPSRLARGRLARGEGGVPEDPEQHRRIGGDPLAEPRLAHAEGERHQRQHLLCDLHHRLHVPGDERGQGRHLRRVPVHAVERVTGDHPRMVARMVDAEVQALLVVGQPARQLAAQRKPAAPGPPGERHRHLGLGRLVEGEERTRRRVEVGAQRARHAVADHQEEAVVACRAIDLVRDAERIARRERQVDDRQRHRCSRSVAIWNGRSATTATPPSVRTCGKAASVSADSCASTATMARTAKPADTLATARPPNDS